MATCLQFRLEASGNGLYPTESYVSCVVRSREEFCKGSILTRCVLPAVGKMNQISESEGASGSGL